ncbi:hypothetical protein BH11PLA2_BH11PLA2_39830 [soil metagenome]
MRRLIRTTVATLILTTPLVLAQTPPVTPPATPPVTPPAATTPPVTAPTPATTATSDYYPLKTGSTWTYKIAEGDRTVEMKVEKVENGEATIATTAQGRNVAKETIKVTADGVYRTKINDLPVTPPVKLLALPATKGATWEINSKVQDKAITGKMTIKDDKEKLKLKDGKEFECIAVEGTDFKVDGTATKVKMWFSPGKGLVKLSYEVGGQEASLEFTDYKEGK